MKKLVALILSVAMLLSLVSVAGAEGGKTTVVFWNSWTGGDGEALQALVDKFNASQDEVFVDMTRTTSFGDMLQTALPTNEAADLILLNVNDMNRYDGYLRPLTTIFDNTALKAEDFSPAYLNMAYKDGQLYGIPFQISTYMMYYNKDLQRFGTDYLIVGDAENGFKANLLGNEALASALIWMKNLYDNGYNPKERDIDSMMAAGQIGLMTNGGWLKGTLDASGINYGITRLPTAKGDDLADWALGDLNCFMMTTSASDETAAAAEKFIEWWFTGSGLEAQEVTQNVDYSGMTPNAEWSISMCYLNAYLPTVASPEYQAEQILVDLTPSETAQVQMFTAPGTLFFSDAASVQADFVENWVFNGPANPTYDDVQSFLEEYQADLEDYIAEYYN